MNQDKYRCPICKGNDLTLRHEASYVYSYKIDSDAPGTENNDVFLSYEYDKREQTRSREYIECNQCGTQYPYNLLSGVLEKDNYLQ